MCLTQELLSIPNLHISSVIFTQLIFTKVVFVTNQPTRITCLL